MQKHPGRVGECYSRAMRVYQAPGIWLLQYHFCSSSIFNFTFFLGGGFSPNDVSLFFSFFLGFRFPPLRVYFLASLLFCFLAPPPHFRSQFSGFSPFDLSSLDLPPSMSVLWLIPLRSQFFGSSPFDLSSLAPSPSISVLCLLPFRSQFFGSSLLDITHIFGLHPLRSSPAKNHLYIKEQLNFHVIGTEALCSSASD